MARPSTAMARLKVSRRSTRSTSWSPTSRPMRCLGQTSSPLTSLRLETTCRSSSQRWMNGRTLQLKGTPIDTPEDLPAFDMAFEESAADIALELWMPLSFGWTRSWPTLEGVWSEARPDPLRS